MPDLKNKILAKIEDQKPRNQNYFVVLDWVRIVALGLTFFCGGIILAFFFWDWIHDINAIELETENFWETGLNLAILGLSLISLFSVIAYFLYRQTDWPMVQKRGILASFAVISLIACMAAALLLIQNTIEIQTAFRSIDKVLPFKSPRPENVYKNNKRQGKLVAKIERIQKIEDDKIQITVVNPFERLQFEINTTDFKNLKENDVIQITTLKNNPNEIIMIKKLPAKKLPQEKPVTFLIP